MFVKVNVTLTPETWIIAPLMSREQIMRWTVKGWIEPSIAKHLDRAFPRDSKGRAIMFKHWIESPIVKALKYLRENTRIGRNWQILDESGFPINYVVIPGRPLVYRRVIFAENIQTMEVFEYIDGTFKINFVAQVPMKNYSRWERAFILAGRIGLMGRGGKGYGRFTVTLKKL